MPLTPEELRTKILERIEINRAAMESWTEGSLEYEFHKGRLEEAQEILTMIDSGGANAS